MQWDKTMNPTCSVNVYDFFIGNAVPNIITDWALLVLPIPYIWRLHQVRAQKVALCGVFGLGGLYVPCIARLPTSICPKIQQSDTKSCDVVFVSSPLFAFT